MTTAAELKLFIIDNFLFGESDQLTDDTPLVESRLIDSTGMLEIIGFMETTFRVAVKDDEVIPENVLNLSSLSSYSQWKTRTHTRCCASIPLERVRHHRNVDPSGAAGTVTIYGTEFSTTV